MSEARTADVLKFPFHSASHHDSPDDVLGDNKLSVAEKRVILSSWASDMYAVASNPTLREVPGLPRSLRLEEILDALRKLDEDDGPPPRGGMAMRVWRPTSVSAVSRIRLENRRRPSWRPWVATRNQH